MASGDPVPGYLVPSGYGVNNDIARIRDILEKWHLAKKETEFGKKDIKPPSNGFINCPRCGNGKWMRYATQYQCTKCKLWCF